MVGSLGVLAGGGWDAGGVPTGGGWGVVGRAYCTEDDDDAADGDVCAGTADAEEAAAEAAEEAVVEASGAGRAKRAT